MKKQIFFYAITLALLMLALQFVQYRFLMLTHSFEIYAGILAILFTALGIYAGKKLTTPRHIIIEKEIHIPTPVTTEINTAALQKLGISKREMEILTLMQQGLSNNEIAQRLFLSINTVKTHTSNLFVKLDVKRRTQAVMKAKELGLLG